MRLLNDKRLRELSLFSGYGGFSLGLRLAGLSVRTVAYVEIESYCQQIIKARIVDGYLDDAPIYPDIRTFDGKQCRGVVDIITAGFPCQPFSNADRREMGRRGEKDERNLWPETKRVIAEVRPDYVLLENVPGLFQPINGNTAYGGIILGELSTLGYDAVWGVIGADTLGFHHGRKRWWCLGWATESNAKGIRWLQNQFVRIYATKDLEEANGKGCFLSRLGGVECSDARTEALAFVGRGTDGNTDWLEQRFKALGNGIVPSVVAEFLRRISYATTE